MTWRAPVVCWVRPLRDGRVELFARAGGESLRCSTDWFAALQLRDLFEAHTGWILPPPAVLAEGGRRDGQHDRRVRLEHRVTNQWRS